MARPWENYKAKKAADVKKAADRVKDARYQQDPLPISGPYPEHAKLYPHTQTNWEIREFWHFLAAQGLSPLSWDELNDLLLAWRGVDKLAYQAEAADMRSRYRWLWEQYEPKLPEIAVVIDETKVKPVPKQDVVIVAQAVKEDARAMLLKKISKGEEEE